MRYIELTDPLLYKYTFIGLLSIPPQVRNLSHHERRIFDKILTKLEAIGQPSDNINKPYTLNIDTNCRIELEDVEYALCLELLFKYMSWPIADTRLVNRLEDLFNNAPDKPLYLHSTDATKDG